MNGKKSLMLAIACLLLLKMVFALADDSTLDIQSEETMIGVEAK